MRYRVMLLGLVAARRCCSRSSPSSMPRFRAGANLVRVDAYVSKDDVALTDLKAEDFTVYEDDKPQTDRELRADPGAPARIRRPSARDPTNVRDMRQQVGGRRARCSRCSSIAVSAAVRFVSRAQADHRHARQGDRPGRSGRRDDAGDVAGVDHLQPAHRQHRARRHRYLVLGREGSRRRSTPRRRRDSRLLSTTDETRDLAGEMIARLREQRDARRAGRTGRASRGAASRAQVRDGVHRGVAAVPPRSTACRASLDNQAPGQDPLRVDPADRRHREAGRPGSRARAR